MTSEQVNQVQKSFVTIEEDPDVTATIFYDRLFEIAPETRSLFQDDMAEQRLKLMSMLGMVVIGLDRLETIQPAVRALAVRHVGYGVEARHYVPVGHALLWALRKRLGSAWTREVATAWEAAYRLISRQMAAAAHGPERIALSP